MTKKNPYSGRPAPAHIVGAFSHLLAGILLLFQIELSIIPLGIFLATCFLTPFFPRISYFLPITTRGNPERNAVAVTFDDGPDPLSTKRLLDLLSKHQVKATFFVSGKRAAQYPEVMNEIIRSGHTVGNHTFSHDHLIMLKGKNALKKEIASAQNALMLYGIRTFVFRPPAGITNPILGGVLATFGLHCINFRCRAFDAGNRRIRNLAKKILHKVRSGDIILLHDTIPTGKTDQYRFNWLNEIEQILIGLKKKELSVLPLTEIIRIPVMESIENKNNQF